MKKVLSIFAVIALSFSVNAQIKTPQPSPKAKLQQQVGLTDVTIEYSRPGVKGRKIFGGLEPFGTVWRTGANKNTTIKFSTPVTIGGQKLKKGTYAIFTRLISAKEWEVIFYKKADNWGTPKKIDEKKIAATVKVEVMEVPFVVETLAIDVNNITNNRANLEIIWEKSYVVVPFAVPTDKAVMANIEKVLDGPSGNDYYAAAVYYLQEGKDIEKAKEWIGKTIAMSGDKTPFWVLRQQSLIHAKAGDKKGAIAAAKKSLAAAEKAENAHHIKLNKESLKEWGAK